VAKPDKPGQEIAWKGPDSLRSFLVPIDELHEDPANTNDHDDESIRRIAAAYAAYGQQRFVVGDASKVVRAGNGQLAAARRLGWTHLAYNVSDLTGTALTGFAIADNRTAEFSSRNEERLAEMLEAIATDPAATLEATGYERSELDDLLERIGAKAAGDEASAGVEVDDPMAEWQGMPECENEDQSPFRTLRIHFRSAEDVQDFAKLLGQKITDGIKFLWHPRAEAANWSANPYVDAIDEDELGGDEP
jgi:ParB-like chromosome segregation protein Spo0J